MGWRGSVGEVWGEGEGGCVRVDVINTNEIILDEDFAFFGLGDWEVRLVL